MRVRLSEEERKAHRRESKKKCYSKYRAKILEYEHNYYLAHKDEKADYNRLCRQSYVWFKSQPIEYRLWRKAKTRANHKKLPFDIKISDVVVPDTCPILGTKLQSCNGKPGPNSPTIDKIVPSKGYVKGNIQVISYRANSLKSDASFEEIEKMYLFLKKSLSK